MALPHPVPVPRETVSTRSATNAIQDVCLIAGTYGDNGLWRIVWDQKTDLWHAAPWMPALCRISYGVRHPMTGLWLLVEEAKIGKIHIVDAETGTVLASERTGGEMPCYVSVSPDGQLAAVAHYGSGSAALLRLGADGHSFDGTADVYSHEGSGPNPERQSSAHVHCTTFSPDGRFLYAVDLGTDEILAYPTDRGEVSKPFLGFKAPSGQGPRHLVFHPFEPLAFLLTELGCRLYLLQCYPDGRLTEISSVSTLPKIAVADALGGHLHFDVDTALIYVTNRGQDTFAWFRVDEDRIVGVDHCPASGASPRQFLRVPKRNRLVVALEQSHAAAIFAVRADGSLASTGQALHVPGLAFLGCL